MVSTSNKNCLHYWDLCDYIPIDAAVALWCNVEPSQLRNLNYSTNCMDVKRELIEWSLHKGELDYVSSSDAWYSANLEELIRKDQVRIKKDSLRDWFLNLPTGDKPAFLFDDSRTKSLIKTELSETERQTMLKLIIGMAIDAYGYNPEAPKNKATGENSGSIKAALAEIVNLVVTSLVKFMRWICLGCLPPWMTLFRGIPDSNKPYGFCSNCG